MEPFLKTCHLLNYSIISQHLTEAEGSLLCSQQPSIGPYNKPHQSSPNTSSYISKVHSFLLAFPPISLTHATFPTDIILLDLSMQIILTKQCKLHWNSASYEGPQQFSSTTCHLSLFKQNMKWI
jgi:hypothetical protein